MFPFIQMLLIAFTVFALIKAFPSKGPTLSVERGSLSMAIFYSFYAAASGLLIAICLSTETKLAKDYRVFWSLLDVFLIFYLCLCNVWFRNKLLAWADTLTKIDI
jgi:hypothetical protein